MHEYTIAQNCDMCHHLFGGICSVRRSYQEKFETRNIDRSLINCRIIQNQNYLTQNDFLSHSSFHQMSLAMMGANFQLSNIWFINFLSEALTRITFPTLSLNHQKDGWMDGMVWQNTHVIKQQKTLLQKKHQARGG